MLFCSRRNKYYFILGFLSNQWNLFMKVSWDSWNVSIVRFFSLSVSTRLSIFLNPRLSNTFKIQKWKDRKQQKIKLDESEYQTGFPLCSWLLQSRSESQLASVSLFWGTESTFFSHPSNVHFKSWGKLLRIYNSGAPVLTPLRFLQWEV